MPPEARTNTGQRPFLNNFQPSKDANDQETRCNAANFNKFLGLLQILLKILLQLPQQRRDLLLALERYKAVFKGINIQQFHRCHILPSLPTTRVWTPLLIRRHFPALFDTF